MRLTLVALIAGLAVINATGVYAQLAHVGERGAAQLAIETQDAALAARIDVQAHAVAERRVPSSQSAREKVRVAPGQWQKNADIGAELRAGGTERCRS